MAKRRRLTPANPVFLEAPGPGAARSGLSAGAAPIAEVARDASASAIAEEMAEALRHARENGLMVLELPLEQIRRDHLVRDRIPAADEEMEALVGSIRARGQQAPIEVVELGGGGYGLISGWRRCHALERLQAETGEARFGRVLALVRRPDGAAEAYQAMVEENEIRVGLSYYERARIAVKAAEAGVFESPRAALSALFASASRPKRSKIGSFMTIVEQLDGALRHPTALPERAGLTLVKALEADPGLGARLRAELSDGTARDPAQEQALLLRRAGGAGRPAPGASAKGAEGAAKDAAPPRGRELAPGIFLQRGTGRAVLSGPGLTAGRLDALEAWLKDGA